MKLDDIKVMSEVDLRIDRTKLTEASIETPLLVNKYYIIYIDEARILKMLDNKINEVYKELYDYYLHLADPQEYIKRPFSRKVLKSDVEMYIGQDKIYTDVVNKIETQKYKVKYLEEIIRQLNQRTYNIKNIIENEKFRNGGF